jgi:hypothetical protein
MKFSLIRISNKHSLLTIILFILVNCLHNLGLAFSEMYDAAGRCNSCNSMTNGKWQGSQNGPTFPKVASHRFPSSCFIFVLLFLQDVFGTYGYVRAESLFAVLVYPFNRELPELIFRMFSAFATVSVRAETAVTFHPSNGSTKMLAKLGVVWTI